MNLQKNNMDTLYKDYILTKNFENFSVGVYSCIFYLLRKRYHADFDLISNFYTYFYEYIEICLQSYEIKEYKRYPSFSLFFYGCIKNHFFNFNRKQDEQVSYLYASDESYLLRTSDRNMCTLNKKHYMPHPESHLKNISQENKALSMVHIDEGIFTSNEITTPEVGLEKMIEIGLTFLCDDAKISFKLHYGITLDVDDFFYIFHFKKGDLKKKVAHYKQHNQKKAKKQEKLQKKTNRLNYLNHRLYQEKSQSNYYNYQRWHTRSYKNYEDMYRKHNCYSLRYISLLLQIPSSTIDRYQHRTKLYFKKLFSDLSNQMNDKKIEDQAQRILSASFYKVIRLQ